MRAGLVVRWRERARNLETEVRALWLASRDPRVPWLAKAVASLTVAYALSPIDLIPDFIPVIGFLDELILLPLMVGLIVRFVDPVLMAELRSEAALLAEKPRSTLGAVLIIAVWCVVAALVAWAFWPSPAA